MHRQVLQANFSRQGLNMASLRMTFMNTWKASEAEWKI